ncbi:hypothetical protein [Nonomuraea sp. NEAU-A123]|uniref:hypothetical protein n=1 Tax=Nonomuraea sp. NEAU-A123 TaxID=2839649 RepID=UPI001BE4799B|nr:hypothetical protein [Nonomuraea sp. NEAU-A123]MBT2228677.1 hypothetical protein [Nonomuraea sp. NEAU-A123]
MDAEVVVALVSVDDGRPAVHADDVLLDEFEVERQGRCAIWPARRSCARRTSTAGHVAVECL